LRRTFPHGEGSAFWHQTPMPEIRTVATLKRKHAEIAASIKQYEKQLAQARSDLAHVAEAIRMFEASGRSADIARCVDTYRLFKRGEPYALGFDPVSLEPALAMKHLTRDESQRVRRPRTIISILARLEQFAQPTRRCSGVFSHRESL
jgi:hypothetical protein